MDRALVDTILRNRVRWRAALSRLNGYPQGREAAVPVREAPRGSTTERHAIDRAAVSAVLDAVDGCLAAMPRRLRTLVRLYYDEGFTLRECEKRLRYSRRRGASRSTLSLDLARIRAEVWRVLQGHPELAALKRFARSAEE